jgi:PAS domain S-box-containing protein
MSQDTSGRPVAILLVEDNPGDARLLEWYLSKPGTGDFQVKRAERLSDALRELAATRFDLVLLDLSLPDSAGLDTVRSTRRAAGMTPIVVMTGLDDEETALAALRDGAQDYLVKGKFDNRELTRSLHYAIERERVEQALRLSEESFRDLFDSMSSGVAVYETRDEGASFILKNLNRGAERIDSLRREEVVGRSIQQVFPGIKESGLLAVLQRVSQTGRPERHPVRRYEDGRIAGWRENYVYRLPAGEVVTVYDDVTARMQAEAALRESDERLRAITDAARDAIIMMDDAGLVTFWNSGAEATFGYIATEVIGRKLHEFLAPERFRTAHAAAFGRFCETGEGGAIGKTVELAATRKDGTEIPAELSLSSIKIGDKWHGVGIVRDITELKQTQARLEQMNVELTQLNELKNQLLDMVDHDLRNPLSLVSTASAFLLNEAGKTLPEAKRADFLRRINSSSEFMLKLIDNLLDVAKIESGRLDLELATGDLCGLIEENLTMNRMLAEKKSIRLDFAPECSVPLFRFDRGKVEQVLNNLISNALKFSAPDTVVTVQASRVNGTVVVSVSDHGQGIPAEELDKLFKPFSKTSVRGTAGEKSTGLGLAICRKIVEGHHGRIWAESEVGKGSNFSFSLPVAD